MFRKKKTLKKRVIQENKNNSFLKSKKIKVLAAALFLSLIVYIVFFSPIFNVQKVEVTLKETSCTDSKSIEAYLYSLNIFMINEKEVKDKIKNKFFCVKDAVFKKSYPNKLNILLVSREPKAILNFFPPVEDKNSSESATLNIFESSESAKINYSSFRGQPKKYLVDSEGIIFNVATNNTDILEINLNSTDEVKIGAIISNEFVRGVELVNKVRDLNIRIFKSAFLDEKFLGISAIDDEHQEFSLLFNLKKELAWQLASLQLILQKAKMNSNEGTIEMIDLRFDKPIVRYSPKKNG